MAQVGPLFKKLEYIPIESLVVSDANVRKHQVNKGIEELARSIQEHGGLLQPILAYPIAGGKYEVLIGQRRYHAALKLGLSKLPALIIEKPTEDLDAKLLSLAENIHRRELPFKDTVEVITALYAKYRSTKKVAEATGLTYPTVQKYLGLSAAPQEVKEMVDRHEITREDARRALLAGGDDPNKVIAIAKRISELAPPEKESLVELGEENPKAAADELIKAAKRPRPEFEITIKLPTKYYKALKDAAASLNQDEVITATRAVQEWLIEKGHFAE